VRLFGKNNGEFRSFTRATWGTRKHWEDLQALVRSLSDRLARFDPSGKAGDPITHEFELLITAGVREDLRRDAYESLRGTIGRHSSEVVALEMCLRDEALAEELARAGGYVELLRQWCLARAAVLSYIAPNPALQKNDLVQPVDFEGLKDEAMLLTNLLIGMDNAAPREYGFPGIFIWLATEHGPAEVLYEQWRGAA
jgi:hypothetical protein